jgi:cytidylate kinase
MIVAIDGPAGSGKSTVARALARRLGFAYLDSGALYRTVTLLALEVGTDLDDEQELGRIAGEMTVEVTERDHDYVQVIANGNDVSEQIRAPRVTGASSQVAARPSVRAALLMKQRDLIASGDHVVEGRDIGTVVAPDAAVKLFLDADAGERASRRADELQRRGLQAQADEVRAAIEQRDRLDSTRSAAPLRRADDAVTIDTTGLAVEDVVERALRLVERARASA